MAFGQVIIERHRRRPARCSGLCWRWFVHGCDLDAADVDMNLGGFLDQSGGATSRVAVARG
jgi:hypothetical protein